jgi:uncharacterized protein YecT (DUF1311 family)
MYKAGGIIAIIAGIFGIFAAGFTLLFGGVASAFKADGGSTVVALGWGGVVFSFLVIVFGAMSFSKTRWVGIALILSSIFGIVLGGTLVAVFMCLSMIGGILVVLDTKTKKTANISATVSQTSSLSTNEALTSPPTTQYEQKNRNKGLLIGGVALLVVSLIGSISYIVSTKSKSNQTDSVVQTLPNSEKASSNSTSANKVDSTTTENAVALRTSTTNDAAVNEILSAKPEITNHRTIVDCLLALTNPGMASLSDRNECERLITKEPITELTIGVDSVDHKDGKYIVNARGHIGAHLFAFAYPRTDAEKTTLETIRMGDAVHLKGKLIFDKNSKAYIISPAYLLPLENESNKKTDSTPAVTNQPQTNPVSLGTNNASNNLPNSSAPQIVPVTASIYQVCNIDGNGEKYLALKEGASASSARILKMAEGTALTVLDKNGDWYQVKMADGKIGWAHSKWLCQSNGQSTVTEKTSSTASSNQSIAPSFNCLNASTRVEKMICNSEELSKLDAQLSVVYKAVLSVDPEKELLKKYQDNWRKNIRDACSIESCVKSTYKNRIAELK